MKTLEFGVAGSHISGSRHEYQSVLLDKFYEKLLFEITLQEVTVMIFMYLISWVAHIILLFLIKVSDGCFYF